jgi:hypothetical protein
MHGMKKGPHHVQVSVIVTVNFLNPKISVHRGRIMARVFWDSDGVIHVDFLPYGIRINALTSK